MDPHRWLRRALNANAAFSTATGALLIAGGWWLGPELGIEHRWLTPIVGLSLVGFAANLARLARSRPINEVDAATVVALDLGWVVGTAAIASRGVFTTLGNWAVLGSAEVVLALAVAQALALYHARRSAAARDAR